jgi:formylglycine-generating enzyme required for sulfatase activity
MNNWIMTSIQTGNGGKPPWGSSGNDGYRFTSPVGHYPNGASPYGLMDMAGNVMQWVNDFWSEGYANQKGISNPQGPGNGLQHVYRGGWWSKTEMGNYTFIRNGFPSNFTTDYIGFRCAISSLP